MGDDFGCVNFAGGEVCHLVAFREPSLGKTKRKTLLTYFILQVNPNLKKKKKCFKQTRSCWYLSQNFPTAVALPRGRVGDDPRHLRGRTALLRPLPARLAGSLRRLAHAAAVRLLGPDTPRYFHELRFDSSLTLKAASRSGSIYSLASSPPPVCRPPPDVTV